MYHYLYIFIFLYFGFLPPAGMYTLTVNVSGLKPLKGDLYISLHNRPESFQVSDSAYMKRKLLVDEETETVVFKNIPAGKYAVSVFHDENLSGALELNEKGIPVEGYGFSTKTRSLARPKFEQAAFDLSSNDTVEIKLLYSKMQNTR